MCPREKMRSAPSLLHAKVMHKRMFPRVNGFNYRVYYLACPLDQIDQLNDGWRFGVNRRALVGLRLGRYGAREEGATPESLEGWIRRHLKAQSEALNDAITQIMLITMPRAFGYDFNPVSFWLCLDAEGKLRAVLNEVNNTFGETHSYLCVMPDGAVIGASDLMEAEKLFHVSPFLPREGRYRFRYDAEKLAEGKLGIWIDYYAANGELQLITSLIGKMEPYSRASMRRAFWNIPAVAIKTIALIHYQALKLFAKKIRYIVKPEQKAVRFSVNDR